MKILKLSVLLGLISLSSISKASESCDQYTTDYDKTYCTAKLLVESDKELNDVYKSLKKYLNKESSRQLTLTQREWIKYRDWSCSDNGTIFASCNYQVNKERTEYLRDRLRECKTGSCNNEAIRRESW